MDLSKLTPAPWTYKFSGTCKYPYSVFGPLSSDGSGTSVTNTPWTHPSAKVDMEFIALARNAFDVMMRRGWWAEKFSSGKWRLSFNCRGCGLGRYSDHHYDDPFTALVEADRWFKENMEDGK